MEQIDVNKLKGVRHATSAPIRFDRDPHAYDRHVVVRVVTRGYGVTVEDQTLDKGENFLLLAEAHVAGLEARVETQPELVRQAEQIFAEQEGEWKKKNVAPFPGSPQAVFRQLTGGRRDMRPLIEVEVMGEAEAPMLGEDRRLVTVVESAAAAMARAKPTTRSASRS